MFKSKPKNSYLAKQEEDMAKVIADVDIDFYISEDGALSRDSKDNLKNPLLMQAYENAKRFIKK